MESKEKVLQVLKEAPAPMKIAEIVDVSGLEKKDVDKAIKALKKEELIASPKACFYAAV